MSDAMLILRARGGDQSAFGALAHRYEPMVRGEVAGFFIPGGDQDDLRPRNRQQNLFIAERMRAKSPTCQAVAV